MPSVDVSLTPEGPFGGYSGGRDSPLLGPGVRVLRRRTGYRTGLSREVDGSEWTSTHYKDSYKYPLQCVKTLCMNINDPVPSDRCRNCVPYPYASIGARYRDGTFPVHSGPPTARDGSPTVSHVTPPTVCGPGLLNLTSDPYKAEVLVESGVQGFRDDWRLNGVSAGPRPEWTSDRRGAPTRTAPGSGRLGTSRRLARCGLSTPSV